VSAIVGAVVIVGGCANAVDDEGAVMGSVGRGDDRAEKAMLQQCDGGNVLHGIDVSYHQGHIDWDTVKQQDVHYAIVRVSDGLGFHDSLFSENWNAVKAAGLPRGVYQFFRSNVDPIAEADLLINKVGQLEPGDLPPVIDVESDDGESASTIVNHVNQWIDHVQSALGVRPIVYTGPFFWRDNVGGADETASPLWIADYTYKTCPRIPPHWTQWLFDQYDDKGVVSGINDNQVDMDRFNGSEADLAAIEVGGTPPPPPLPPPPAACGALDASGGIIDNGDACMTTGGNPQYLHTTTQGYGAGAVYTGTTASSSTENFAEWTLNPSVEGTYTIEMYVGHMGTARQAKYEVTSADGTTTVTVNQDATSGFASIGNFHLVPGVAQKVRLGDNTGEAGSLHRTLAFDALRATPSTGAPPPPPPVDTCPRVQANAPLNVRPQPNTSHAAIDTLASGDIVTHVATVQGQSVGGTTTWYQVKDGNVTGFVSGAYASCHD
jgi:GH25 family lysozyme M1 (1,4-beta-N-acetylmuramidase)